MIFESKKLSLFFGIFILVVLILGKFDLLLNYIFIWNGKI